MSSECESQASKVVTIFWERLNIACEKGFTVMNALSIPEISDTVPYVLIRNVAVICCVKTAQGR